MRYKGLPERAESQTTYMGGGGGGGIMADLKLPEMAVVYVLGTGHTMRTNIASGNQTDRMIQVRASLPTKREGIKNKVPPTPVKAKVGSTFCRKTNMVTTTFIVASGLKITHVNVSGKVIRSKEKGRSLIHRLRNLSSWHMRGLDGSTVIGITRWGGDTSPTFPQTDKDPLATRSKMVSEINSEKAWQLLLLGKRARGVRPSWQAPLSSYTKWEWS